MFADQRVFLLKGKIQNYNWGGYSFIPQLLGIENAQEKPVAEYWLGAHPNHPANVVVDDSEIALNDFIKKNSKKILGEKVEKNFGSLPYLLKILDVRQMLSIQVHPDKASAEKEFEEENKKGIPVTAPHRNYKDKNHKPEMMVALSDFWLLHGFKPEDELVKTLAAIPEFNFLLKEFSKGGYESLYRLTMEMKQEEVDRIIKPVADRILPLYHNKELLKDSEDFWAARAVESFCKENCYDRGIFSIYFFNLLHLKKGEGIYQPAGLPHAYLEGQNVEVMSCSDNVLRAGLTEKHIDVNELLKHVKFEATVPKFIEIKKEGAEVLYPTPAREFELRYYESTEKISYTSTGAEIIFLMDGAAVVSTEKYTLRLSKGQSALIIAGTEVSLEIMEKARIFKVLVPL